MISSKSNYFRLYFLRGSLNDFSVQFSRSEKDYCKIWKKHVNTWVLFRNPIWQPFSFLEQIWIQVDKTRMPQKLFLVCIKTNFHCFFIFLIEGTEQHFCLPSNNKSIKEYDLDKSFLQQQNVWFFGSQEEPCCSDCYVVTFATIAFSSFVND